MTITHFELVITTTTGAFLGIAGVCVAIYKIYRWLKPIFGNVLDIVTDLKGEPARLSPMGREIEPAKPSLAERLGNLDDGQLHVIGQIRSIDARLMLVEHELTPNSGRSIKDQINTITQVVTAQPGGSSNA